MMPKEYELELRVKNGLLLDEMRRQGYETAAALSRASGVSQGAIGDCLNLRTPLYRLLGPYSDGFVVRDVWQKISDTLGVPPDMLVPEHMRHFPATRNVFRQAVDFETLARVALPSGETDPLALVQIEMEDGDENGSPLERMLAELGKSKYGSPYYVSPRTIEMVRLRFGEGMTLQQLADHFELSRARVRQIIDKVLRQIRSLYANKETFRVAFSDAAGRFFDAGDEKEYGQLNAVNKRHNVEKKRREYLGAKPGDDDAMLSKRYDR